VGKREEKHQQMDSIYTIKMLLIAVRTRAVVSLGAVQTILRSITFVKIDSPLPRLTPSTESIGLESESPWDAKINKTRGWGSENFHFSTPRNDCRVNGEKEEEDAPGGERI